MLGHSSATTLMKWNKNSLPCIISWPNYYDDVSRSRLTFYTLFTRPLQRSTEEFVSTHLLHWYSWQDRDWNPFSKWRWYWKRQGSVISVNFKKGTKLKLKQLWLGFIFESNSWFVSSQSLNSSFNFHRLGPLVCSPCIGSQSSQWFDGWSPSQRDEHVLITLPGSLKHYDIKKAL